MQDENSFIPLSGAAVASKSAICCSMLPTFSGDMLFCVTSARNAEISAVIEDVSIIPLLFCNKSIVDTVGGKRQEKFYYLCQKLDEDTLCCRFVIFAPINRNLLFRLLRNKTSKFQFRYEIL